MFVKNINWMQGGVKSCGHAEGLVQTLTGAAPGSSGNGSYSSGPSADVVISQAVNPAGTDPMALYSGSKPSFIADRISFQRVARAKFERATKTRTSSIRSSSD